MIREFEGKNEEDAIKKASDALGIAKDKLEIEAVENKKPLFFIGKGRVVIKVKVEEPVREVDSKVQIFVKEVLDKMTIMADVQIKESKENKTILDIISKDSAILIGKKGKTLDALQLLANIVAGKGDEDSPKIIVDVENYRFRREKNLIAFAKKVAEKVKRSRSSMLLEAMNPFERRLIHTTLNKHRDIETISEGEGLYKKIRVLYKGKRY